jgi:hypothetical protein
MSIIGLNERPRISRTAEHRFASEDNVQWSQLQGLYCRFHLNTFISLTSIMGLSKVKQSPLHAMGALGGREDIAPIHCALPPGNGPPVPIGQEARWTPEPVWTQRLEGKFFHLFRRSNLDRPVVQSVGRRYAD